MLALRKQARYQKIPVIINQAGVTVPFSASTDHATGTITGLAIEMPEDNAIYGSTVELSIAGEEIFPEGFPVRFIAVKTLHDIAPSNIWYAGTENQALKIPANGASVTGKLTDGSIVGIIYPYTAHVHIRLENLVLSTENQ